VLAPNSAPAGSLNQSTSAAHGDFDDDIPTVTATLHRMLNNNKAKSDFNFKRSESSLKDRRQLLQVK
jgi:hypothetical protein